MSNGLPNYGRYISRPTLAALSTETSDNLFPFPFALVTFADGTLPALVFNQKIYQFLEPGQARQLVDADGNLVVDAAPDLVPDATNYLTVQNASGEDPVEVSANNASDTDVDLVIFSQKSGMAALSTGDQEALLLADASTGARTIKKAETSGTTVSVFTLDRVAATGVKAVDDGGELQFRVLDSSGDDPFGALPVTAASISARIHTADGSTSSLSFAINGLMGNALVLNPSGATVEGKVALNGIAYRAGVSPPFVGFASADTGSTFKVVVNGNVQDSSIISITPRIQLVGASQWWVDIPPGGGSFQVSFDAALGSDWTFNYEIKQRL